MTQWTQADEAQFQQLQIKRGIARARQIEELENFLDAGKFQHVTLANIGYLVNNANKLIQLLKPFAR